MFLEDIWKMRGIGIAESARINKDERYLQSLQAQAQNSYADMLNIARSALEQGTAGGIMGVNPSSGMSHLGLVREFRRKFKEYSKAEFREVGSKPVIKDILSGMTKLNKEDIKDRIAEHFGDSLVLAQLKL